MFDVIRNIIEGRKSGKGRESREEKERRKHVAAGVVLLEAAYVDNECSKEEIEHIVATIKNKFLLSDNCVDDLLELACKDRENAIDLWQFTNHINDQFSLDEKLAVMEDVWRIILLDGKLDKHEDHFAHKLANLFHLSHSQLIAAKLKAREQLAKLS